MSAQYFLEDVLLPSEHVDSTSGSVRTAFHSSDFLSAEDVGKRDNAAKALGTTYGATDADFDNASMEIKMRRAEAVPKADAWVAEAPENAAFLKEDADALTDAYDGLVANGLLSENDIDRDTVADIAQNGNGLEKAIARSRINMQLADLGNKYNRGEVTADEARSQARILQGALEKQQGSDVFGFYGAVEQLYRMGAQDIPHMFYRGAEGALAGASAAALAGAAAGSALPVAGTAAGAGLGAGAGAVAGFGAGVFRGGYETSQQMETGLQAIKMLLQQDDAGNYLDDETVKSMSTLYGVGSALVETVGDAVAMKLFAPVVKTVGAVLGVPAKQVMKDAISLAVSNKKLMPVLMKAMRPVAIGAAAEGAEEAVQEALSEEVEAIAKNSLTEAGVNYFREDQPGLLGADAWKNIGESAFEGAKMGFWFHVLPGVTKFALDTRAVLRARDFAHANKEVLKSIENTKTQQLSPVRMESFLKHQGLNQTVLIPADVAWQMQQQGTDLAGAFGWEAADLEEAAALKHDIAVPLARLHSANIPTNDKHTLFDVMREKPETMSAAEAMDENVLAEDADSINAAAEEWEYQQDRLDMELDRLRAQITEAVRNSPVLLRQLTTSADTETSVGMYVDSMMRLVRNAADRLSVYGADADSIIDRLNVQGLVRDLESGRMYTPEEIEHLAEERAQAEAYAPFWDMVWGRLDAASLKRDFPEARQEIAYVHGRGIFAKRKGEGVPIDELADELVTAGLLPPGSVDSDLVEMLKDKRRPSRRRGSRRFNQTEEMNEPANEQTREEPEANKAEKPENTSPEAKLAKEVEVWVKLVDGMKEKPREPQLMLTQTPLVFHLLGAEFREVYAAPHVFDGMFPGEARKGHNVHPNIDAGILKQLPAALADPIAVFKSDSVDGRLVFMLDVKDANGATVVVPVTLDTHGKLGAQLNIATSAYAKENNGIPSDGWFIKQAKKNARYINGQKWKHWSIGSGATSPLVASNTSGKTVLTEADLVKEKKKFPTFYHLDETGIASEIYATGSIQPVDGNYYIQLFKGANLSTLAHEVMHAVHLEMERLEAEGKGTPELKKDLEALRNWTSHMDDDANLKAEYNRYQRGQFGGKKFSELSAEEKAISRSIAKQEMIARGFEAYLREGTAPSRGMEGVFRRFKKWLTRIYKDVTLLDVELTDDVRRVFDNIVAADEDIRAAAQVRNMRTESASVMDALGLKGASRLELEGLVQEAEDKAADALRKDRNKAIREQAKKWAAEADEEIGNETVYRVRAAMRKTPIDYDAVVESCGKDMADRLMKKLPASIKRGGDNPETLAFDYGFRNAGEMIQAVLNAPGVRERRAELIAQKRRDAEGRFAAEDYLFEQDALAQKEERIGEAIYRMEAEGRTALGVPIQGDYSERAKALREQIRVQVERILDGKTAADAIRPDTYRRATAKALREERQAILAKDWATAIQANYRARINLELARQAAARRDLVDKVQRHAKRFLQSKEPNPGARFGVFVLAMKTHLFAATQRMLANADGKTLADIHTFLEKMGEEGLYTADAAIDENLFTGAAVKWPELTWETFRPYLEAMATMMHMERTSRRAQDEQNSIAWREEMDGIAKSILDNNKHRSQGSFHKDTAIIKALKEFHASHLKADTICRLLDGDEDMGPAWRAIIRPINQATWERATRMKKERDAIKELYSVYTPSEWVDIRGKRYFVDAIKTSITKEQALAVLLNSGNESNFRRLLNTMLPGDVRITEAGIRAIIDTLDERDVKFAQAVWDYLETFRKESFDLEEELSGVRPKAIHAAPVQTKYGTLRGGYYPVYYDKEQSSLPIDTESIGTLTASAFPAVDHGSMKQRTNGLSSPVTLNLEVLPQHVVKTVHMLAFRKPVQQVARVLNDGAVAGAIASTAGAEQAKALKSWLHYVAGERPASNGFSRTLGWLRKNSSLYAMGIRLSTMFAQMTGILPATAELGPRWAVCGIVRTYCRRNPFMVYKETAALSPMMANRMKAVDRDLHEMSTGLMKRGSGNKMLDPFVRFHHWQQENAYLPMGFVQMAFCDLPTWQGAFAKALHEGKSRDAAIEYADTMVERTQVGGEDKDLAAIQRGNEMGKIMTQFYSYFSALYQLFARRITMLKRKGLADTEALGRLGTLFLLTGVLEPVLSALITGDAPDDDENWYAWGARKVFFNPFNMVIGVRDLTGAIEGYIEGYGGRARVGSLVNDIINAGVRFCTQIEKGLDMDAHKVFASGWKLVGLATGAVNSQELLLIDAFWDWLDGTNPDFELAQLLRKSRK